MDQKLEGIFQKYETLARQADSAFAAVARSYPDLVACKPSCADCCHALFDLSLVEAVYLNHWFNRDLAPEVREKILAAADRADRKAYQVKREAFQLAEKGQEQDKVFSRIAFERVRCPLLDEENRCMLYDRRPITCRLYGIPTAIEGKGHTCGFSGFAEGEAYPTVSMDVMHQKLFGLSLEFCQHLDSKYGKLSEVLMPVSMALMTVFNDEFLGIRSREGETAG
ncbi:MAG: YkgJ family cysteine cluster protein [Thermodesulfobacteriota bacterium]